MSDSVVEFNIEAKHLEDKYPEDVTFTARYSIEGSTLKHELFAKVTSHYTEAGLTPINMTNHTYFNLNTDQS